MYSYRGIGVGHAQSIRFFNNVDLNTVNRYQDILKHQYNLYIREQTDLNYLELGNAYLNMSAVYKNIAERGEKVFYNDSINYYLHALTIRMQIYASNILTENQVGGINHQIIGNDYYNLGKLYEKKDDYYNAIDNYNLALSFELKAYLELLHHPGMPVDALNTNLNNIIILIHDCCVHNAIMYEAISNASNISEDEKNNRIVKADKYSDIAHLCNNKMVNYLNNSQIENTAEIPHTISNLLGIDVLIEIPLAEPAVLGDSNQLDT